MNNNRQYKAIKEAILNLKKTHYNSNDEERIQIYENQVMRWLNNYKCLHDDLEGLLELYTIAFE